LILLKYEFCFDDKKDTKIIYSLLLEPLLLSSFPNSRTYVKTFYWNKYNSDTILRLELWIWDFKWNFRLFIKAFWVDIREV